MKTQCQEKKRDNTDKIKSLKIDEIYEMCKDWWSYLSALERQPTDRWPRWTLEFGLTLALAKSCSQAHHGFQTVNGFSDDFPKMSCLSLCWRKLSFIIKSLLAAMQSTISVINNCLALSSPLPLFFAPMMCCIYFPHHRKCIWHRPLVIVDSASKCHR